MDDQEFQAAVEKQQALKVKAAESIIFRKPLPLNNPKARFPGFYQRVVNYKAGQQLERDSLPLPTDLVMHESVPMVLRDGNKLYSDIFLPAEFQNLSFLPKTADRVPALIAWLDNFSLHCALQVKTFMLY